MSQFQTACALMKTRVSLCLWLGLLSSICTGLTIGCSAAELAADEGASYSAEGDFAGETSGNNNYAGDEPEDRVSMTAPSEDYGSPEPDVAGAEGESSESAGEAGVGELACSQEASSNDGAFVICLDEITLATDDPSREPPDNIVGSDTSSSQCDLAEALSKALEEQTGEAVSCADQDADCYYYCEGWTLPARLQDPDDQRSFITGIPSDSDDMSSAASCQRAAQETEGGLCCPVNFDEQGIVSDAPSREETPTLCRFPIPLSEGSTLKLITACQGGGLMWVSADAETQSLNFAQLSTPSSLSPLTLNVQSQPLSLAGAELNEIKSLACLYTEGVKAMFVDEDGELYYLGLGITGAYEISKLYPANALLDERPLSALNWRAYSISVDELGLFRWELEILETSGAAMERRRFEDYAYGYFQPRGLVELSSEIVQRTLSCQGCDSFGSEGQLTSASLTTRGTLQISSRDLISGELTEGISLSPPLGFFDQFKSTASLIGVTSIDQAGMMSTPSRVTFSLWSDERLRELPIFFEPSRWGFEYVDLASMVGGQALLKLTRPTTDQAGPEWGLYDVYTDRIRMLEPESLITSYFGHFDLVQYKSPILTSDKILWLQEDHMEDSAPEVIMLKLPR